MGRPKKEIDQKQFENLCGIWCTQAEICSFFSIDHKTLDRWCIDTYGERFSQIYKKLSEVGNISLRRYQFQHAKKSVPMAIFLGKQHLGQRDYKAINVTADEKQLNKLDEVLKQIGASIEDL